MGCQRCALLKLDTCCDLHNPELFTPYQSTEAKNKRTRQSRLPKDYKRPSEATALIASLEAWRKQKTEQVFGSAYLHDYGGSLILPRALLDKIVDRAYAGKLSSLKDLARETQWRRAGEYGSEVLRIVRQHIPLPSTVTISSNTHVIGEALGATVSQSRAHRRKGQASMSYNLRKLH